MRGSRPHVYSAAIVASPVTRRFSPRRPVPGRHGSSAFKCAMVTNMLKHRLASLLSLSVLVFCPATTRAQAREVVLSEITLQGTVTAVDHTQRTVSIRGQQGNVVTLDIPLS